MFPFVESLCVNDGRIERIDLHTERTNRTRRRFYPDAPPLDLRPLLTPPAGGGRMKCRVTYGAGVGTIGYAPYRMRPVSTLRLVSADTLDYTYKRTDRSDIDALMARRGAADDILIVRRGLLTDTSICNVALRRGATWYTPAQPLLCGTHRAALLAAGKISEAALTEDSLADYSEIMLFNALIPPGAIRLPVSAIVRD